MTSVSFSAAAANAILSRCERNKSLSIPGKHPIPCLLWSNQSFFTNHSGHRTEFGPQFFFSWTNEIEAEQNNYYLIHLDEVGQVALAPGELFSEGSHAIEMNNDRLILSGATTIR